MIRKEYIEKAKDSVTMLTLFKDLYPNSGLRKCGARYRCKCVFHADSNPSLYIDPVTNLVHCFGCHKTFDRVGLVMENKSLSYPQAIEYLLKEHLKMTDLKDIYQERSDEDIEKDKCKDSQMIAMQYVQEFYTQEYDMDSLYAKGCRDYTERRKDNPNGRWDADKVKTFGFGYAPVSGHALVDWAAKKGINLDTLVDIGVATCYEDKNNRKCYKDLFHDRLTMPQRNSWGRVIAYTARRLSDKDDSEPKYMNSRCTESNLIYKKEQTIYGIDVARKAAKQEKILYLMEGAPDVIALYTLDIYNAVASNGGSWSINQLTFLRSLVDKICFIPDMDAELVDIDGVKVRRGESFVFRSAAIALSLGFKVSIKEIPGREGEKTDVDSYFKTRKRWDAIPEQDFIDWYTAKVYRENDNREQRLASIAHICDMLSNITDASWRISYLDDMKEAYPPSKFWDIEMKRAMRDTQERISEIVPSNAVGGEIKTYGFSCEDHKYFVIGKDGKKKYWTNFDARPLFHITDDSEVTRIFEITNVRGQKRTLEVEQSNITRLEKLKEEIEKQGNFRYKATFELHELFKDYIYDNMPSAIRLERMGWHGVGEDGFLVFADGIGVNGEFHHVDEYGIVEYDNQKFFLPAFSILYKNYPNAHKNLKRFEYVIRKDLTIETFFRQVMKVYPNHGMQELAFVMATIFLDIIREDSGFFPLMFHYGLTETGKTQLAVTATRFFQIREEITNIENSSLWAMNDKALAGTNIICHHDEYKNSNGKEKVDYFKGVFDNASRSVRDDKTSKRRQDDIMTGHIITGQEIPNFDPALMTRAVLMEFYKNVRTVEETQQMEILKDMRDWGVAQLTLKIVSYRKQFQHRWQNTWLDCLVEVKKDPNVQNVGERIIETWTILYAVVKCLHECGLETPIDIRKLYNVCISGILRQQELLSLTDEVAIFWLLMKNSYRYGEIREMSHFNVKKFDHSLLLKKDRKEITLQPSNRPVLMLCMDACMGVVNHRGAEEKKPLLNEGSLISYLRNTPEYIGTMAAPTKFKMLDRNGNPIYEEYSNKEGKKTLKVKRIAERAMIFDYYAVRDKYDVHLTLEDDSNNDNNI